MEKGLNMDEKKELNKDGKMEKDCTKIKQGWTND